MQITNAGGTADSETAVVSVAAPAVPLVLDGTGDIAGENIQHANGNVFDQIFTHWRVRPTPGQAGTDHPRLVHGRKRGHRAG